MSNKSEIATLTPPKETELPSVVVSETKTNFVEILSVVWNAKKLVGFVVGATTVLAVVISLLLPESFKATTTILPETEKGKLAGLGGLSDLASLAGVNVGEVPLTKLYPAIINSEVVLKKVIYARYPTPEYQDSANLIQIWEIRAKTPALEYEGALKALRSRLDVSVDTKTSLLTLGIETRYPQLSADILNNITHELDEFMRTRRTTSASEQRKWIESRLAQVKLDLERAENKLKNFRETNRQIVYSPQLQLEQGRLVRDVEINNTLYIELKKQYELAKIEEIKNIPIINVLDPARPPARKENPKRSVIVLTAFFLSTFGSLFFVIIVNRYEAQLSEVSRVFRFRGKQRSIPRP